MRIQLPDSIGLQSGAENTGYAAVKQTVPKTHYIIKNVHNRDI